MIRSYSSPPPAVSLLIASALSLMYERFTLQLFSSSNAFTRSSEMYCCHIYMFSSVLASAFVSSAGVSLLLVLLPHAARERVIAPASSNAKNFFIKKPP